MVGAAIRQLLSARGRAVSHRCTTQKHRGCCGPWGPAHPKAPTIIRFARWCMHEGTTRDAHTTSQRGGCGCTGIYVLLPACELRAGAAGPRARGGLHGLCCVGWYSMRCRVTNTSRLRQVVGYTVNIALAISFHGRRAADGYGSRASSNAMLQDKANAQHVRCMHDELCHHVCVREHVRVCARTCVWVRAYWYAWVRVRAVVSTRATLQPSQMLCF